MRGVSVQGAEVLAARVSRGLTQEDLSRLARVDVKTVRKAEQGKRLDFVPLARLAEALNTDLRLLIVPDNEELARQVRQLDVVMQWHHAFNAQDTDKVLSFYHEDAVLRLPGGPDIPFGGVHKGKSEIRLAHETIWQTVRQKQIRADEMEIHVTNKAVILRGDKGVYTPSGELVYFPCLLIFQFLDNLIIDHQVEYDTLEFAKRMQPS